MLIPTVCAALGAVAAHFTYTTLGLVLFAAAALIGCLIICSSLVLFLSNWLRAFRWSRQYRRRVHPNRIHQLAATHPERFVLHVRLFRQIGRTRLDPVCILEDTLEHELIAVFPPTDEST